MGRSEGQDECSCGDVPAGRHVGELKIIPIPHRNLVYVEVEGGELSDEPLQEDFHGEALLVHKTTQEPRQNRSVDFASLPLLWSSELVDQVANAVEQHVWTNNSYYKLWSKLSTLQTIGIRLEFYLLYQIQT